MTAVPWGAARRNGTYSEKWGFSLFLSPLPLWAVLRFHFPLFFAPLFLLIPVWVCSRPLQMAKGWMSLIWKWDRAFTKWNGYSPSRDQMRIHIPLWLLAYKSVQDCLQVMDPGGQMWRREQQEKEAMERAQREMLERQERLRRQQEEEEEEERRAAQFLGPF